jgi:hypothetical protein
MLGSQGFLQGVRSRFQGLGFAIQTLRSGVGDRLTRWWPDMAVRYLDRTTRRRASGQPQRQPRATSVYGVGSESLGVSEATRPLEQSSQAMTLNLRCNRDEHIMKLRVGLPVSPRRCRTRSKLTWLVLGGDPQDRSHRVEQLTAL